MTAVSFSARATSLFRPSLYSLIYLICTRMMEVLSCDDDNIWGCWYYLFASVIFCLGLPAIVMSLSWRFSLSSLSSSSPIVKEEEEEEEKEEDLTIDGGDGNETKQEQRRRRRRKRIDYPNLPESLLIFEILARLPVKSLLRFRCVCKSWKSLILEDPEFLAAHFKKYCCTPSSSDYSDLLIQPLYSIHTVSVVSFHNKHNAISVGTMNVRNLVFSQLLPPSIAQDHNWQVSGSCHGIVFLVFDPTPKVRASDIDRNEKYALWNPITNHFKSIPPSHSVTPWSYYRRAGKLLKIGRSSSMYYAYGFGFDSKSKDHKILEILYYAMTSEDIKPHAHVAVYTLSTNSWRKLDADDVFNNLETVLFKISVSCKNNRLLCWLVSLPNRSNEVILYFDMCDESFRTMELPPAPDILGGEEENNHIHYKQIVPWYDQSVALIHCVLKPDEEMFDIWVMKEFGIEESWTRLAVVGHLSNEFSPLGFWKNGEFILRNKNYDMVLYNLATRQITKLGITDYRFVIYKESLISF